MIKIEQGRVEMKGDGYTLLAEFMTIAAALMMEGFTYDAIKESIPTAKRYLDEKRKTDQTAEETA